MQLLNRVGLTASTANRRFQRKGFIFFKGGLIRPKFHLALVATNSAGADTGQETPERRGALGGDVYPQHRQRWQARCDYGNKRLIHTATC